jgi:hypothetical protein
MYNRRYAFARARLAAAILLTGRLCRNPRKRLDVMLSPSAKLRINSAKHLAFSSGYDVEILRVSPQNDIET